MATVIAWPRLLDPDQAREYVGGKLVFGELKRAKLVSPRVKKRGCTRYDRVELDNALDRWAGFNDRNDAI
jgi:hypothetical protein